jgi:hypothetical protein
LHHATLDGHAAYKCGEALAVARRLHTVEACLHPSVGHHLQGEIVIAFFSTVCTLYKQEEAFENGQWC